MIITDMPSEEYHRYPAIGSTTAKLYLKSPQLFRDAMNGLLPRKDSPSFQIGRTVHMAVCEPERFATLYVGQGPINPKTGEQYGRGTKAWAEWQAANPDTVVVDPWVHLAIDRMPESVCDIFTGGIGESSVFVEFGKLAAKCRPDYMAGGIITDLKTIDDVDHAERAITQYKYWLSAGWYRAVMRKETGVDSPFRLVFVEKQPPYRWRIVHLSTDFTRWADDQADKLIGDLRHAMETGDWTDPAPISVEAPMPAWLDKSDFTIDDEGISL